MSIPSISPLDEVRQTSPLQQWAAMLQEVPAPTTPQTPRLQPGNGDIMSQLGGLFEALMPLLQQLVMNLQQQQQPLLNSLAGAAPGAGASPLGGASPFGGPPSMPTSMPPPPPMPAPARSPTSRSTSRRTPTSSTSASASRRR